MGLGLDRVRFVVLPALLLWSLAGCGRSGMGQGRRDASLDLLPAPRDLALPADERLPDSTPGSVCGNMVLEPGEDCEDGNQRTGDGCDPHCHYEPELDQRCGNTYLDPGEGCDDGNRQPGDGCDPHCCVEVLWSCPYVGTLPCHCGNGMLEWGEECDDGNHTPGDGCNQYCDLEHPTCGNGMLDPGEQCDDGNRRNDDQCDAACFYDPPSLVCTFPGGMVCADGKVGLNETCDDGNVFSGDGCSATCTLEPGYYCPTPGKSCLPIPTPLRCGDATRDPWEACDDGINDGRYDGCNPDCSLAPRCGDGIVQPEHEACDLGRGNGGPPSGCRRDCTLGSFCGDGVIDPGEECDEGKKNGALGSWCSIYCLFSPPPD